MHTVTTTQRTSLTVDDVEEAIRDFFQKKGTKIIPGHGYLSFPAQHAYHHPNNYPYAEFAVTKTETVDDTPSACGKNTT